jgi:hypothetical protein
MRGRAISRLMPRRRLDRDTAERMLDGAVAPADAPPGFEAVAELLRAAGAGPGDGPASAATGMDPRARRRSMLSPVPLGRRLSSIALAAAALTAMTGAAYAAGLPATATATASSVLDTLGIAAPRPAGHRARAAAHRAAVADVARATTAVDAAKGATVSTAARAGKHRSGARHGSSPTPAVGTHASKSGGGDPSSTSTTGRSHRTGSAKCARRHRRGDPVRAHHGWRRVSFRPSSHHRGGSGGWGGSWGRDGGSGWSGGHGSGGR